MSTQSLRLFVTSVIKKDCRSKQRLPHKYQVIKVMESLTSVACRGLENRRSEIGPGGSNPSLSADKSIIVFIRLIH